MDEIKTKVKQYYGEILTSSGDLQTSACCDGDAVPDWLKPLMQNIHPEVASKYYGCGLVAPDKLRGMRILDLGSGSGRDCYLLAQLVGADGYILGIDMTDEQLKVANEHLEYHRQKFGFAKSNVEFKKGHIEKLDELDIADNSFDIIISNCVINLSEDKPAVFREAQRVLKPGGEMYFSDVYANLRIPEELVADPVLYGECLSGALYWNDFLNQAKQAGFTDPRLVSSRRLDMHNKELEDKTRGIDFYSATYRLFKIPELEAGCEDYGQAVKYLGSTENLPQVFKLDSGYNFVRDKITPVCGNSYLMLAESRFAEDFEFFGSFAKHFGSFENCGDNLPTNVEDKPDIADSGSCC